MAVTAASLRAAFPAFASTTKYPDAMIALWLPLAVGMVNADRWGESTDLGVMLYAAHNLALESQATADGVAGRSPGGRVGVLSSKGADGISASYDVGTSTEKDVGHWNLTTYGTRFIRLSRMFGAGPLQVGPSLGESSGGAWTGPLPAVW